MARLFLVRHAQASFGAEDYDKLSELGLKQSAYIPGHFGDDASVKKGLYRGNMLRQKETADIAFPSLEATINKGLNEFDHMNVLSVYQPAIHDKAKMTEIIMNQKDPKQFIEDEFRTAMDRWMFEEGTSSYHETFKRSHRGDIRRCDLPLRHHAARHARSQNDRPQSAHCQHLHYVHSFQR
jgi:broad specificity phosphatase PhoE